MTRNILLITIVALAVVSGALGYWFYEQQNRRGVDISIGGSGVSIRER